MYFVTIKQVFERINDRTTRNKRRSAGEQHLSKKRERETNEISEPERRKRREKICQSPVGGPDKI